MHNPKSFKLFKSLLSIIALILLLTLHLPEARTQESSSTPDSLILNQPGPDTLNNIQNQSREHEIQDIQPQDQSDGPEQETGSDHNIQINSRPQPQQQLIQQDQLPGSLQDGQPIEQPRQRRQGNMLNSKVEYNADTIEYDLSQLKAYLWGDAWVKYENMELRAAYIEVDIASNEVFARGLTDSLGVETGRPVMTEGSDAYEAKSMRYNFETERGHISGIITEQEGGFLHGETTKKHSNDHLHIRGGKYTSCDAEHPHFYIALTRAVVIPDDKVVSGPAYLVLEDIPLPIAVPFGFFPNKPDRTSGILFPTYGEEASRGFYLREAGYYLHINDYMDLRLTGDIYSLGSWSANASSNYRARYRFSGSLRYAYSSNVAGERGLASYQENTSYNISWSHRQDPKASPYSNLSASVNFGSSSFNKFNTVDPDRFAQNTAQSSISFSHRWPDSPFSLTSNVSANQNFANQTVNLRLPSVNFNMARQYPFRNPERVGESRWYENIELSYTSKIDNRINTYDTLLFRRETLGDMHNGFQHDIPLRANFRLFNLLNITPGMTYSGVMYTSSIRKTWVEDHYNPLRDEVVPSLITDTIPGIVYGHSINPNFSTGLSQNIYGMFQFTDSKIEAIRHVMTPSVSFSFTPDMQGVMPDYYREVQSDTLGRTSVYSIFDNGIYGTPSIRGRAGSVSLSLANNIEMKIRDTRDTVNQSRKVKILDRLNFSTNYNVYADSMNWSTINMTGNTSLLENKIRISFNAVLDPYALDENLNRYNVSEWSVNRSPGRITRAGMSLTMGLRSAAAPRTGTDTDLGEPPPGPDGMTPPNGNGAFPDAGDSFPHQDDMFAQVNGIDPSGQYIGDYIDFNIPWNLNVRYNLNYTKPRNESQVNQTLNFSGDLSLTPRWKLQFSSGYDFRAKDFTMTNISVYRDLHCWEMRFGVVPFGSRKSWNFTIQVKSSLLQDLKYSTQRSWYDNFAR